METEELYDTKENQGESKEGLGESLDGLTSHIGEYAQTFYKLMMVKLTRKASATASVLVGVFAVCILGSLILIMASVGLGWWLGDVVGSRAGGFLLVAGFWTLILGIALMVRKSILYNYFRDLFISKFYE